MLKVGLSFLIFSLCHLVIQVSCYFINFFDHNKCVTVFQMGKGSQVKNVTRSAMSQQIYRKFVIICSEQWELAHSNSLLTHHLENPLITVCNVEQLKELFTLFEYV